MNYEFHPDAEQEFIEEAAYYESEVPGLGARFADDWMGIIAATVALVLLPISLPLLAILMLFVSSSVAGPLALWPAILAIGVLDWFARKRGGSLLIR